MSQAGSRVREEIAPFPAECLKCHWIPCHRGKVFEEDLGGDI